MNPSLLGSVLKPFRKLLIRARKRREPFITRYPGFSCSVIDKSSFLFMHEEIFGREIYRFIAKSPAPRIIDCGANIGLSVIYFKQLYPAASITAFEPDPKVFATLESNVKSARLTGVTLVRKGLGREDGQAAFFSEGADAGRMSASDEDRDLISVETTRLSRHLGQPIDFLKIDIEGSELEVLEECEGCLGNVSRMFVEYHSRASKPQRLDRILEIISSAGFRYYIQSIGVNSRHPFIARETSLDYDIQLNISCYRQE